ncbi:MAG TPA: sugar ABC transporter permease [Thermomicrobiales bacterium]|jgi:multiple sugar transport system permease protein|nr:sugar ABC transporter permease [Thermomicrobiales bacterium]
MAIANPSVESTAAVRTPKVSFWSRQTTQAQIAFWVFVGPMIIGLTIFTFIPIVWGFLISLSDARNSVSVGNWVWLENYRYMIGNNEFRRSLITILIFTAFIVPLTTAFALALAMLVNALTLGRGIFRTIFFIPTAVSYVVASLIWKTSIFTGVPSGFANTVVYWLSGSDPTSPVYNWVNEFTWYVLVSVRLWLQVGFYMIILIAALQNIPRDLYEAAYVDGGKPGWTTFVTITLPQLRNAIVAVVVLNLIGAFQAFDEFYNILSGGLASSANLNLARTPLIYTYQIAIGNQDYGRGAAAGFILTAIIIVITVVQGRLFGFGRSND